MARTTKVGEWPEDYRALKAWGIMMGSLPYYIRSQQQKAWEDRAPIDAVYFRDEKGWVRLAGCARATVDNVKHIMSWMK
jgi:hypothetical protein